MSTPRQRQNLRRGGIQGTPETAARARAAKAARHEADELLAELGSHDPWGAYQELHATMTRHISKLLRDEERSGGTPSRNVTDRLREFRITTQVLSAYRAGHAANAEMDGFFATLDERVANLLRGTVCPNCGEQVAIAKPVVEPPE